MIQDVLIKKIIRNNTSKHKIAEVNKYGDPFFKEIRQTDFLELEKNEIKAFLWHRKTWTQVFLISGEMQLVLHDTRQDSLTYEKTEIIYGNEDDNKLILIPPKVAYGFKSIDDKLRVIIQYSESRDPENLDEIEIPENDPSINFNWNLNKDIFNVNIEREKVNLLVCGGAGFIGSNFIHYMMNKYPHYKIVNYDKLTYAGNLDNLRDVENKDNYVFVNGDICDYSRLEGVIKDEEITHVINFAAETHVDRSIYGGCADFVLTNSLGVQMILDAVKNNGIKRYIQVSTDEVFGSLRLTDDAKFDESWPIMPNMPYAAAKAGGDLMCNAYYVTHKVPVIVTHCSNNYGPYQFPEKLIPFFIFKILAGEKVPVYGDGLNIRDWIHAEDHARALDLLLHKGEDGEVYNIGVDNERSNIDITRMVLKLMGKSDDMIEFVKDRPGHDRKYAINSSKIRELGWEPKYTKENFEKGLKETIDWYLNNKDWVINIQNKKSGEMNSFKR